MERDEAITLLDEHGHSHDFTLVDVIEVGERRYAILHPAGTGEDAAVVFRLEDDTLMAVEDEAELEGVAEALEATDSYEGVRLERSPRRGPGT